MITARIVRGMTLSLREREFVQAARFMGVPPAGIIFRHLHPEHVLAADHRRHHQRRRRRSSPRSGLSYFGFGVQPPDVSLGTLIADGTQSAFTFPWLFMFAGGLLVVAMLAVSVVGDGLRDALDPASDARGGRVTVQEQPTAEAGRRAARRCWRSRDLTVELPQRGRRRPRGARAELHARARARCSASSASRARASRSRPWRSWACCRRRRTVTGSRPAPRPGAARRCRQASWPQIRGKKIADGLPGPAVGADAGLHRRRPDRRGRSGSTSDVVEGRRRSRGPSSCSTLVGIPNAAAAGQGLSRTSSPAACGSGSMIAMAIANDPDVIIADEPTTALDVTIQAQVLEVLDTAQEITGAAIVMITHDLGVVAGIADRVIVMYAGKAGGDRRRSTPVYADRGCRTRSACSARCRGWTARASR